MRAPYSYIFSIALGSFASAAVAVDLTMTSAGFTGLGVTPTAHLLGWGHATFAYDNQLPGVVTTPGGQPPGSITTPGGHNYVLGFGLLPNLELAGRLAANDLSTNCYAVAVRCFRDLSASAKVGIGLDARNRFRIAAGATDLGGAVTYFRAYYGVLTYTDGSIEASAGLARRAGRGVEGSRSPLNGPFASAAWQPAPWIRGHVEYTDKKSWAGARVFLPAEWLPGGWSLSAGLNVRLVRTELTERTWWSTSLSIPLYNEKKSPPPQNYKADPPSSASHEGTASTLGAQLAPASGTPLKDAPSSSLAQTNPAEHATAGMLRATADALQARGLEDIWVGRTPDGTVAVRANNGSYRWNSLDALGGRSRILLVQPRSDTGLCLHREMYP
jgi:hypothetical protein